MVGNLIYVLFAVAVIALLMPVFRWAWDRIAANISGLSLPSLDGLGASNPFLPPEAQEAVRRYRLLVKLAAEAQAAGLTGVHAKLVAVANDLVDEDLVKRIVTGALADLLDKGGKPDAK